MPLADPILIESTSSRDLTGPDLPLPQGSGASQPKAVARLGGPVATVHRAVAALGRTASRYSRWAVRSATVLREGDLPPGPVIAVSWHGMIMVGLGVHAESRFRPCSAFVTPGLPGVAMRGWLSANRIKSVPLPRDGDGNASGGLKQMARSLRDGEMVAIALDGPRGPSHRPRPGALWLARLSGAPLVVVASVAGPSLCMPRWDKQVVPLPGAHIAIVYGEPFYVDKHAEIDESLCLRVASELDKAERRAREILQAARP